MHENLKSTINLQPTCNEEGNNELWQTLVPAYEYGTFFVLYGKFRGIYKNDKCEINEMDFYLQNYQGLITMGLLGADSEIDVFYDNNLKSPVYVLKVDVKPLETNSKIEHQLIRIKQRPHILKYNYTDASGNIHFPYKNEFTNHNNELKFQHPLMVVLKYNDLDAYYFDSCDLSKCRIINDTKYERDGDQLLIRDYKIVTPENCEKEIPHSGDKGARGAEPVFDELTGTVESYKCYPTYARLT